MTTRFKNAFLARNRFDESDELPWLRIPGLTKLDFPRPLVLINGAFDLFHAGHARLIFAARDKAATLVCAMDSDDRVSAMKGPGRPIQSWVERATMLGYMPIDALVEIYSDSDMKRLVQLLKPDLRVQGIEYKNHKTRFPSVPRMFVTSYVHTSGLIDRIKKL